MEIEDSFWESQKELLIFQQQCYLPLWWASLQVHTFYRSIPQCYGQDKWGRKLIGLEEGVPQPLQNKDCSNK